MGMKPRTKPLTKMDRLRNYCLSQFGEATTELLNLDSMSRGKREKLMKMAGL